MDPRQPVECFGVEASNRAKELLEGQEVSVIDDITQGTRDKYGRLLYYIQLKDGTDVAETLIREGYAHEYTYIKPYKRQTEYREAETYAREHELGLWAPDACKHFEADTEETKKPTSPEVPEPAVENTTPPETSEAPVGDPNLKITYIFYDGVQGRNEPDEYVEIKDTGGPANLAGYTLQDESGKTFTFPSYQLGTGETVKVFTGCGNNTGSQLYWCFTKSAVWNNTGGDTATLRDPDGGVVDTYSY